MRSRRAIALAFAFQGSKDRYRSLSSQAGFIWRSKFALPACLSMLRASPNVYVSILGTFPLSVKKVRVLWPAARVSVLLQVALILAACFASLGVHPLGVFGPTFVVYLVRGMTSKARGSIHPPALREYIGLTERHED